MPVAVVDIVRDYTHSYSDSGVHRLLDDSDHYLRVDHTGVIQCNIGNVRQGYTTCERHYPYVFSYTSAWCHNDIRIGHIAWNNDAAWMYLEISSWDSILNHFDSHRSDTWDQMRPGMPMPTEFIHWCDAFIRILKDQLGPMVCPWQKSDGRI